MFGTIRRHQNWLWLIIIAVIIVSFVIFFSPDAQWSGSGRSTAQVNFGSIDGKPIGHDEFMEAYAESKLNEFFRNTSGKWPGNEEAVQQSLQRNAIYRVLLVKKLKELDIKVSETAVARLAHDRIGDYPLANFAKDHLQNGGVTIEDFERFMRHEAGIQQLVGVAALSAKMLNPQEAEVLYRKENQEVATEVAIFSSSNLLDKVTLAPGVVGQFYTNRLAAYRLPERIQVSYLDFAASNFLADADKQISQITNFNANINEYYFKQGTNFFKDTNGVALLEPAAKQKIRQEIRDNYALKAAHRKASEFGNSLFEQPQPNRADNLDKLAAAGGLTVKVSPPFDRAKGLEESEFPPMFRQKAFALTKEDPIQFVPIVGEHAVYLIALKNKIPSEQQPFDKVQEKVAADYKNSQALDMARRAGQNFYTAATNGLAIKKTFSELAVEAKAKVLAVPPFSPSMTSLPGWDEKISLRLLQNYAAELEPGKVSNFIPQPDGGIVLYLRDKLPIEVAKMQKELPDFLNRLRVYRQNEAFNQWFRKQIEQSKLVVPQPESVSAPGGKAAAGR